MGVLFVCMGNICRSPTAEGVFRVAATRAGLLDRLQIDSAGTHGYHAGEPPDRRAIVAASARGYDIAARRARQVERDDFARFHWILAMDQANLRVLTELRARRSLHLAVGSACVRSLPVINAASPKITVSSIPTTTSPRQWF